ncbi:hypothetical protein O3677_11725 [Micrococcus luteus]|nr:MULTISPECIES: transposase [Micrococcus]HAV0114632.1 hypothetical protein [Enterococcus faecium]MBU8651231.1 hypothetical protein [Micrococcus luteus]MCV7546339.1 hypothetical protein [Micrococcus luteus]MCV7548636.1 hypothetical protein [Micrococcus luteus]MCV7602950.1 hypothetical protein [Micrococcus luteus]
MPTKFCSELRDRAVRMVYDRHALESGPGAQSTRAVAPELGVGEEPLRSWCNRYGPAERSSRPQESLEEENRRLRSEVTDMRRANEILKKASAFYPRSPIARALPLDRGHGVGSVMPLP